MASLPVGSRVRVLFAFIAEQAEELSVSAGDSVIVQDTSVEAEGWIRVVASTGQEGLVPLGYVAPEVAQAPPTRVASPGGASVSAGGGASSAAAYAPTPARAGASSSSASPSDPASLAAAGGATPLGASAFSSSSSSSSSLMPPASSLHPEYAQLLASHEEWFRAASAKRQEVYRNLQGEAMDLLRALTEAENRSAILTSHMNELDALLSEERAKWAAK